MIHTLFEKAAAFHGHACPGLAMGVRAGAEALRLLEVDRRDDKDLICVIESVACHTDGVQAVTGCTMGKSNLRLRPTGETAFSFYRPSTGGSVRLCLRPLEEGMSREEKTEHILTAPLEALFSLSEPPALEAAPPDPTARWLVSR